MKTWLDTLPPQRVQRVLAVASIGVLVTAIASVGQVRFETRDKSTSALTSDEPTATPSTGPGGSPLPGSSPLPGASAVPGASAGPGGTTGTGTTGVTVPGGSTGSHLPPPGSV